MRDTVHRLVRLAGSYWVLAALLGVSLVGALAGPVVAPRLIARFGPTVYLAAGPDAGWSDPAQTNPTLTGSRLPRDDGFHVGWESVGPAPEQVRISLGNRARTTRTTRLTLQVPPALAPELVDARDGRRLEQQAANTWEVSVPPGGRDLYIQVGGASHLAPGWYGIGGLIQAAADA